MLRLGSLGWGTSVELPTSHLSRCPGRTGGPEVVGGQLWGSPDPDQTQCKCGKQTCLLGTKGSGPLRCGQGPAGERWSGAQV